MRRLIARGLGYRAIEMNASDVRSKRAILEPLKASSGSNSLTNTGGLIKTLVIMDEVDGMSPGDRGGIGALLEVIRSTQVPIICICNDRSCTKLKTLGNVSYDIRFSRPNKTQIAKRLLQITAKEGLQIEPTGLEHLVECAGNDIRQVLTMLEMWARYSSTLSYADAKGSEKLFRKDANVMLNNFDAAGLLLRKEEMTKRNTKERMDLFMIDFDLIPLLVYENYLTAMGTIVETKTLEKLVEATEAISFGDAINKQIRSQSEWGLLQAYGMASSIEPGLKSGFGVPFPKFPEWFSRNSAQKKNERLLMELRAAMAGFISGDDEDILTDYIPLIYKLLMQPLKDSGREGVNDTLELMETYNLSPEMFKEHLIQLQFGTSTYEEEYKALPTQVKSAITRTFNSNNEVAPGTKSRRKPPGEGGSEPEEEEDPVPPNTAPPRFDPEIEDVQPVPG